MRPVGACNASASLQASHLEPRGEDLRELLLVHSVVRDKKDTTDTRRQGKLSKLDCQLSQNQETDCCGPECVVQCVASLLASRRKTKQDSAAKSPTSGYAPGRKSRMAVRRVSG